MASDLRAAIDKIKAQADIVEIIGAAVPLRKAGKDYVGICPFHPDRDPSFSVAPDKKFFKCFGCGASGDVITFWMQFHHVPFMDAVQAVARYCGMELQGSRRQIKEYKQLNQNRKKNKPDPWCPEAKDPPRDIWQKKALEFVYWTNEQLFNAPKVLAWLKTRGIDQGIGRYGLGWNPVDRYRAREAWGLSSLIGEKGKRKPLWLPAGLVIPVFINGNIGRIRIRRPEPLEFGPRYYLVPGSATHTMILEYDRLAYIVVESELDAILIAQEAGELLGVMAMGSSTVRPDTQATEILQKAMYVIVALDFDGAGAGAWHWWKKHFPDCERWPVTKRKDPGEAFQVGVNIRKWIHAGLPPRLR